jgi:molecular chaperone GrpE
MADDDDLIDPELEALQREAFVISEAAGAKAATPAAGGQEEGEEASDSPDTSDAEKLLRLSADFANYRRRMERDRAEQEMRGVEKAVIGILPVLDHLDLALSHAAGGAVDQVFLDGMLMIRDQFLRALEDLGIVRIEVTGSPFDPNEHEAVAIVPAPGIPEGTIVGVVRPGYRSGGRLLRPASVTVAAPPSQE